MLLYSRAQKNVSHLVPFRFVSFNFRLLLIYRSLSVAVPFVPFVSFRSVPFCGRFPNLFHAAIHGEASFG